MELGDEREEKYCKFSLDLSDAEAKYLRDVGLKHIENDEEALIEYAVNFILEQKVEDLEKVNNVLKGKLKKEKEEKNNGKSKSWR